MWIEEEVDKDVENKKRRRSEDVQVEKDCVVVPVVSARSQQPFGPLLQAVLLRALYLPAQHHEQEDTHHLVAHLQPQVPVGRSKNRSINETIGGNHPQQRQQCHLFLRMSLLK